MDEVFRFIEKHENAFLWIDEYAHKEFYDTHMKHLLYALSEKAVACIMNFSPYFGQPDRICVAETECTNPNAYGFTRWLAGQPFQVRPASPKAVFGDYLNAGHWIVVRK
ncbi:MAG: hypothetical protein JRI77_12595 [Deltaproteobacteria bacterium]|nr:hypothetical protein [Deltaproteobacteria bacterium]